MTGVVIALVALLVLVLVIWAIDSLRRARRTMDRIFDEELGPRDDEDQR